MRLRRALVWLIAGGMSLMAGCLSWDADERRLEWEWPEMRTPGKPIWQIIRERIERHDPEAVREFWVEVLEGLHGNDPERLADMADLVDEVSERHSWIPGVHEYSAWLSGRRLYFEAMRDAQLERERGARMREFEEERRLAEKKWRAEQSGAAAARRAAGSSRRPSPPRPSPPRPPPLTALDLPPAPPGVFSREPTPVPRGRPKGSKRESVKTGKAYWDKKLAKESKPVAAGELVPVLEGIFRKEGIPEELVWVAEVESSMNPAARSPAGAVGLFQLMPRTARSLGLELKPEDQRLDPRRNARAAAVYLRRLYGRFDCWSLTLAAYNAGEGRVAGLRRTRGATFDAIEAGLPMETRLYVPRVFATIKARSGVDPETLPPPKRI